MGKSVYERFGTPNLTGSNQTARRHTVAGNETLSQIASDENNIEYDSEAWRQIAEYNGVSDLDSIQVGLVLTIPTIKPTST